MTKYLFVCFFLIAIGCTKQKEEKCQGKILDLELESPPDGKKLMDYFNSNKMQTIKDTIQFVRFWDIKLIDNLFVKSSFDSTKKKFTYKIQEAIIKEENYQWDLLAISDNDQKANVGFWLKSYDNNRRPIDHLDFASWSKDLKFSGRIDCDSTLHVLIGEKDHRILKTDKLGENFLVEWIKN